MAARRRSGAVYIDRSLIQNEAFLALTGKAPQVLLIFFGKRRVEKLSRASKRGARYRVANNGQIIFTYREAERDYGLKMGVFRRAIDQLIEVGFLDIAKPGNGLHRDATLYALSDRWRRYGQADFERRQRPKGRPWTTL